MTLDSEDIDAIAEAVAAKMLNAQRMTERAQYENTLPLEERKRLATAEMRRETRERKQARRQQ